MQWEIYKKGFKAFLQLEKSLTAVAAIKATLTPSTNSYLKQLATNLVVCQKTIDAIQYHIMEQPPATIMKGGFIKNGVDPSLDELRSISSGGKEYDKQVLPEMYEISPAPTPPSSTASST